jgi:hypothetical protein
LPGLPDCGSRQKRKSHQLWMGEEDLGLETVLESSHQTQENLNDGKSVNGHTNMVNSMIRETMLENNITNQ